MRVININTTSPAFNLAAEEYMFEGAVSGCPLCLIWQNSDSIIVGVNQNTLAEINAAEVQRQGVRVVRRLSGGGAVFHDLNNINYSFITDASPLSAKAFAAFTSPVIDFLAGYGIKTEISGRNDICVDGKKISGTAQYTKDGKTLFHGTLLFRADGDRIASLLRCDPEKFTRKGIASVASRVTGLAEYLPEGTDIRGFKKALCQALAGDSAPEALTGADIKAINGIKNSRYATDSWNYGRFTGYGFNRKKRYPFGSVEVGLEIKNGIITAASISGDFFSLRPAGELEAAMTGMTHSAAGISGLKASEYICGMTDSEFTELIL